MTICIAALCDNATKVVMCSDRMITTDKYAIKFEHGERKIEEITKYCAAITAGDALSYEEVLDEGRKFLEELKSPTTKDVVEAVKEGYRAARAREVAERILGSWPDIGGYAEDGGGPPEAILEQLSREALEYDMLVELLLGGVDRSGGHVFLVTHPGTSVCFDTIGFHAVGSGEPHAVTTLVSSWYDSTLPLRQSVFLVFLAKKVAEKAPGVGKQTDLCYIDKKGIHFLDDKQMEYLQNLVQEKEEVERSSIEKIRKAIDKIRL